MLIEMVTQGVLASRKTAIVSRTLSDLVAQQPATTTSPCTTAGVCDSTMTSIFAAASTIMTPFSTAALSSGANSLTMTISSVEFVGYTAAPPAADAAYTWVPTQNKKASAFTPTATDPGYKAMVRWSKTAASPNDGALRACNTPLTIAVAVPPAVPPAPSLTELPSGLYSSGSLIIADVTYKYDPPFGGSVLAWSNSGATFISMKNTTYMRPRNWTTYITYPTQSGVGAGCTG